MAAYLYQTNVSPRDTFQQFSLRLDNGTTALLGRGLSYDLSANEVSRARQHIVLVPTSQTTSPPNVVAMLPVIGDLADGDVPVWNSSLAAFVPEPQTGGGGGAANVEAYVWDGSTYVLASLSTPVRFFFGPADPTSVLGITMRDFDNWMPTGSPG